MADTKTEKTVQRRKFFATIGLGSAAAVVAAVTPAEPAEAMTPPGTKGGKHYTESEHVKEFYRVNRY
jgi:hypothetical protein